MQKVLLNNCFNQYQGTLVPISPIWQSYPRRPNLSVNMKSSCHGKRLCGQAPVSFLLKRQPETAVSPDFRTLKGTDT